MFVLAGYIACAEAWTNFSKEWEQMLPYGTLSPRGTYHFKMQEMAANPERMARVVGFYRIAEKYALGSVSCKIDIAELKGIQTRLRVPGAIIDWELFLNPYFVAFRGLMDMFHIHRSKLAATLPLRVRLETHADLARRRVRSMTDAA